MDEVFGIFPVPIMRAPGLLPARMIVALVEAFTARATESNNASGQLAHTRMLRPTDSPLLGEVAELVAPKLSDFGVHLLGERLPWLQKEMWVNVLDPGGRQAMHNHANSFVSCVLYLTATHPGSQTVFMKAPGGTDFLFRNDHQKTTPGPYNADKWVSPAPAPGDMLLFPSYLMHAVPPNQGPRRMTLAINALPRRIDSWGYVVELA